MIILCVNSIGECGRGRQDQPATRTKQNAY